MARELPIKGGTKATWTEIARMTAEELGTAYTLLSRGYCAYAPEQIQEINKAILLLVDGLYTAELHGGLSPGEALKIAEHFADAHAAWCITFQKCQGRFSKRN